MKLSRLRIILLTFVLASVALWVTNQQSTQVVEQPAGKIEQLAYSWQTKQTQIWKISRTELEQQTIIKAHSFLYKDKSKTSEFIEPNVQLIDGSTTTQLSSKRGRSVNDELITFEEEVVLSQNSPDLVEPTTLQSEHLQYNSRNNTLATDAKVIITQYNGQTSGVGLEADLNKSEYKLLSNVNGIYDPQKMTSIIQPKGQ